MHSPASVSNSRPAAAASPSICTFTVPSDQSGLFTSASTRNPRRRISFMLSFVTARVAIDGRRRHLPSTRKFAIS